MLNCFWFIIIKIVCPIIKALASIGALYVALAELSDRRKANLVLRLAPPYPECEVGKVRKLSLVLENKGNHDLRDITVSSTPPVRFGYSSSENAHYTFSSKRLAYGCEEYLNFFDPQGDVLNQSYTFSVTCRDWLGRKIAFSRTLYWDMFSHLYARLPPVDGDSSPLAD